MDDIVKKIGFILFGVAMIIGGLQIIVYGSFQRTGISNGVYNFDGLERLIGLFPVAFGTLVIYLVIINKSKMDKE